LYDLRVVLAGMDLNIPSFDDLPVSFSLGDIRFVTRPKVSARDAIVRRYGERGYDAVIASTEPFIMIAAAQSRIVILVLT
jgi:hypothetical protein